MSRSIRLSVAHPYARTGLEAILERAGYEPVVKPPNGSGEHDSSEADLTIVGVSIEPEEGLTRARRLREADPDHPVLLLLPPEARPTGEEAIENGMNGYLLLDQDAPSVAEACEAVLSGRTYRPPPSSVG